MSGPAIDAISQIVAGPNPDLIVVTDDVYGTFVPGFKSLMAYLPHNVIGVYSFSKYFGCTGWRLGVIAVHENNVADRLLLELDEADRVELARRYRTISLEPASWRSSTAWWPTVVRSP